MFQVWHACWLLFTGMIYEVQGDCTSTGRAPSSAHVQYAMHVIQDTLHIYTITLNDVLVYLHIAYAPSLSVSLDLFVYVLYACSRSISKYVHAVYMTCAYSCTHIRTHSLSLSLSLSHSLSHSLTLSLSLSLFLSRPLSLYISG